MNLINKKILKKISKGFTKNAGFLGKGEIFEMAFDLINELLEKAKKIRMIRFRVSNLTFYNNNNKNDAKSTKGNKSIFDYIQTLKDEFNKQENKRILIGINEKKTDVKNEKKEKNSKKEKELTVDEMVDYLCKYHTENIKNEKTGKKLSRAELKQYLIDSLKDSENPYSNVFRNKILKSNYNVEMAIKGFHNGCPLFKIVKLKEEPHLPPIYNTNQSKYGRFGDSDDKYSNDKDKNKKNQNDKKGKDDKNKDKKNKKKKDKGKIPYDVILDHFEKKEDKDEQKKEKEKNEEKDN